MTEEEYVSRARQNFMDGYNCSQSVALAFADHYGIDATLMARMIGPFGAGIGRMRETCGAACGMFMLSGLEVTKQGEAYPDIELKKRSYVAVQELAAAFKEQTGSLICRELLGLNKQRAEGALPPIEVCATPEPRTEEYYRKRPCVRMVETATRIYYRYLQAQQDKTQHV